MASLVNYGVESDRDSDDGSTRGKSSERNLAKPQTSTSKKNVKSGSTSSSNHDLAKSKANKVQSPSSPSWHRHHSVKEKKHHKHHKRSRSRSRSRDRKDKRKDSREREKEYHHHRDDRKKRRSRSRSRSRSSDRDRRSNRRTRSQERREKKATAIERMGLDISALAASVASSEKSQTDEKANKFPSAALQAAQHATAAGSVPPVQSISASLPGFYNPATVNVAKYTQQIQKRKLLWANKKEEVPNTSTAKMLGATAFTQDQDGKMTAKFKRLMGIKQDQEVVVAPGPSEPAGTDSEVLKKQQELFASLDQQYQIARATTHTQRGLGLGFSSNHPR